MDGKQQKIIIELQRVARLLEKKSLSQREFSLHSQFSVRTIENAFGSWNRAIEAAGLTPITPDHRAGQLILSDDELLQEIVRLSAELGKRPSEREMSAFGHFSIKPYRRRWGTFSEAVKVAYAKYGAPSGFSVNISSIAPIENGHTTAAQGNPASTISLKPQRQRKKTQYGEPLDFRGLRHAPVNEQGVVYLFGMVSRELGFLIESLRTAYPDCEGKRCVDEKRQLWENILIEFEFKSSNFREHGHNPQECDLIVCWIHDWIDCPLEVLELRSAIGYLPNR